MYSSFLIKEISLLILGTLKISLIDKISNLFHLSKENQSLLTKHPSACSISWPVLHVDLHLAFCPAKLILLPQMFLKRPSLTSKLYSAHVYFQSSFFFTGNVYNDKFSSHQMAPYAGFTSSHVTTTTKNASLLPSINTGTDF